MNKADVCGGLESENMIKCICHIFASLTVADFLLHPLETANGDEQWKCEQMGETVTQRGSMRARKRDRLNKEGGPGLVVTLQ